MQPQLMASATSSVRLDTYQVFPGSPQMENDFILAIASLGAQSNAFMTREVARVARANRILPASVQGFEESPDRGQGGWVQLPGEGRPRAVVVGTRAYIAECGLEIPAILETTVRQWELEGESVILLGGWDAWVRGVLRFVHR